MVKGTSNRGRRHIINLNQSHRNGGDTTTEFWAALQMVPMSENVEFRPK